MDKLKTGILMLVVGIAIVGVMASFVNAYSGHGEYCCSCEKIGKADGCWFSWWYSDKGTTCTCSELVIYECSCQTDMCKGPYNFNSIIGTAQTCSFCISGNFVVDDTCPRFC